MRGYLISYIIALALIGSLAFQTSCVVNEADIEDPSISSWSSPIDLDTLSSGDTFNCTASFADNRDLFEFSLAIAPININGGIAWEDQISQGISGVSCEVSIPLSIPLELQNGSYQLQLLAEDVIGNRSDTLFKEVYIQNSTDPNPPVINISTPNPAITAVVFPGGNLVFLGLIGDDQGLDEVTIAVHQPTGEQVSITDPIPMGGEMIYELAEFIQVPEISGDYYVEIRASDLVGNVGTFQLPVEVL